MGRPRKPRKRTYKDYYERSQQAVKVPESTLRYVKKPRHQNASELESDQESVALHHNESAGSETMGTHQSEASTADSVDSDLEDTSSLTSFHPENQPEQGQQLNESLSSADEEEREEEEQLYGESDTGEGDETGDNEDTLSEEVFSRSNPTSHDISVHQDTHLSDASAADSEDSDLEDSSSVASFHPGNRSELRQHHNESLSSIDEEEREEEEQLYGESDTGEEGDGTGDNEDTLSEEVFSRSNPTSHDNSVHQDTHLSDASAADSEDSDLEDSSSVASFHPGNRSELRQHHNESLSSTDIDGDSVHFSSSGSQYRLDLEDAQGNHRRDEDEQERNVNEQGHFRHEGEQESDDDGELRDPFLRLKSELGGFQERKDMRLDISVGEIMINALTLAKKHNWSHLEKEHLMKFVGSLLGNIVPSTRFLLDEYFYSKKDMMYYFYCSECSKLLGQVPARNSRPEQLMCPNKYCNTVNFISDLSKATYFVTFYLPSKIEALLSDPNIRKKIINPSDFAEPPHDNIMSDMYHGSMYRDFANQVKTYVNLSTTKVISLSASVDSASLCRSFSGQSICPCFVTINELPPVIRMGNPLLAGLWFGKTKEKMDLFLPPIVEHITNLSKKGFTLHFRDEDWFVKAFLIACCADSVARCDVQGIHGHRGDFPCSWCLEEGEEWNSVRIFRYAVAMAPRRTLEELVRDSQEALRTKQFVNGVKYLCPLAPAPFFHSVNGFIVDPMHAKDEGTTKSFLKAWLGEFGDNVPFYIGSPTNRKKIDSRLTKMRPPKEFRKSVRKLEDLPYWTGRELENWGLYMSISVLDGILPNRYLKHWGLFVQANYILLSTELPIAAIDVAEQLLEKFCSQVEHLYSPKMMRFNLHITRHFAANSRRWGQMYALSAYAYEAGNLSLKNLVHNANYIPNQICRGFSEDIALILLKHHCETFLTKSFEEEIDAKTRRFSVELEGNVRLLRKGKKYNASEEEEWFIARMGENSVHFLQFPELVKEGSHFSTDASRRMTKTNNSFARLFNKQIVSIKNILFHEITKEVWVVTRNVRCEPSSFCPDSVVRFDRNLCFQFVVSSIDDDIEFHNVSALQTVCVSMKFSNTHYVSPMANIINMF